MNTTKPDPNYVIHSDAEPLRLDRQARLYGGEDDLRFVRLRPSDQILDAGCGSGSATRLFARHTPAGRVIGVDRNPGYLDYAQRTAASEGLTNTEFRLGDVLSLPFENASFDVVWSKHLLQWVARRTEALAEFVRVARPGGRVVCSNFDGFCLAHYPTDADV
jgi:ubiquinone/menaquinone biosynthesis C-methylase UbiE